MSKLPSPAQRAGAALNLAIRFAFGSADGLNARLMLLRALIALLVLPGVFAGVLPAWIVSDDPSKGSGYGIGLLPLVSGLAILLWCVRDFYVAGKGTLAPWDPPKNLVIVGLYRFTRNPMYVGITVFLIGWSLFAGSPWLGAYTVILTIAFHLRVVLYEEPRLSQQFGEDWVRYSATVPRWLLRLPYGNDSRG